MLRKQNLARVVVMVMMAVTMMARLCRGRGKRSGNGHENSKGKDATGKLFHGHSLSAMQANFCVEGIAISWSARVDFL